MILLTGFYEDGDSARQYELLECLKRNVENDHLAEIHLFAEEPVEACRLLAVYPLLAAAKIRLIAHGRRVTYRDLFAYANNRLPGRQAIIANGDIFFDHTLALLADHDLSGKLLCLSRWDIRADGFACLFNHPASQDAWIFQAPIREFACEFHLGVPGCDNRLAWEAEYAGLMLSNPSRSVQAYHLHLSGVRRYSERQRLAGPTKAVAADFLNPPRAGPNLPCASVAFRESMGYTVARLDAGVSSHNNDFRPFTAVPELLSGLQFTQVVSMSVSPVDVEFLTPGKLYVLVGNDWEGYFPATSWLSENGFREDLPLVETQRGTGFEVWSLIGDAGERFVLPTQLMLAAGRLVRNDGQRHFFVKEGAHRNTAAGESLFALTSLPQMPESDRLASCSPRGLLARTCNQDPEIAERSAYKDCVRECFLNTVRSEYVVQLPTRHLLIATRPGCGLWSMFFEVIGLIRYAEREGLEPVVYFNDATCWWSQDGYNGSRNAWEYFFKPISRVSAMQLLGRKNSSFEHASLQQIQAALPDDLVMSEYILDHIGHYDHTEAQRQEYASIVERRIRVKSQVLEKLDPTLVEELTSGATAVHYRGTDKSRESPRQSVHEYYDALQQRVDPSHKLFVATDDASFLKWMIETFGDRVLYTQAARSHDHTALHLGPHRGPQQAEECLLDVLLMAKCQHLVHGNSSVTNGVLVFNSTMSHDALHRRQEIEKPA